MELVKIGAYAEGYYSGQSYEEDIFITKESYEKFKEDIDSIEIYIYELDGKHSEVEADLEIEELTEEDLLTLDLDKMNDGEDLYYKLKRIFENNNLSLNEEMGKIDDYLSKLDSIVTFEVTVKKSQKDKVLDFIKILK